MELQVISAYEFAAKLRVYHGMKWNGAADFPAKPSGECIPCSHIQWIGFCGKIETGNSENPYDLHGKIWKISFWFPVFRFS